MRATASNSNCSHSERPKRPNSAAVRPTAITFGSSVSVSFLNLGRGLHDRNQRPDDGGDREDRDRQQRRDEQRVAQETLELGHPGIVAGSGYRAKARMLPNAYPPA